MRLNKKHIKKFIILPIILIGSDFLIMFVSHFSGSTGNDFTLEGFINYLSTLQVGDLLPPFLIAILVVLYVHHIERS